MTVRFGLIGAGRMGANLARHLAYTVDSANLVAIADPLEEAARSLAEKCRVPDIYTEFNEMLVREDIDAVLIVTPTNTHVEVIKAAAAAGKHIFTEKPLALTIERCDEAIAAVEANGVKLHVGFMRRFDPAYVSAKRKIDAGVIGNPVLFKSIGRDSWRPTVEFARRENSGGLIMDMGIHDFDLARWLMGSEVVRVYCEGGCLLYPELAEVGDIDNAVVALKFTNGTIGDIEISRSGIYGYDIRTEIVGTEGSLFIGNLNQTSTVVLTKGSLTHDTIPGFMARFPEAYAAEIQDFVEAIEQDRPVAVDGHDARAATAVAIAATRSLEENRPVHLREFWLEIGTIS
jgi:inositol 2-dehydrogenase